MNKTSFFEFTVEMLTQLFVNYLETIYSVYYDSRSSIGVLQSHHS
jgi:hypothetical protein